MRQALAGMLWGKQYYFFDLDRWLEEHHVHPLRDAGGADVRNRSWFHMINDDVISMPDTWEYPWYASWDLAFHTVALAMVDVDFAKAQLELMLRELYLHPSGQLPAYEWNFSDVNPPVHAWATLLVYETELEQRGAGDVAWLKSAFQKLLVNFTWWINRKDPTGRNVFEGGFLGLDNIGVFDRSAPLPTGGHLEQSDGTAWMAFFAQCMLGIAVELCRHDPLYEDMVLKFAEHFAVHRRGHGPHRRQPGRAVGRGGRLLLRRAPPARRQRPAAQGALDGRAAAAVRHDDPAARGRRQHQRRAAGPPAATDRGDARAARHHPRRPRARASTAGGCWPCSTRRKLRRILARMLDEDEFLSPHGLRALSRYHARRTRSASTSTARPTRFATCRPSPTPACSAATRTGAARCGSPSTTSSCAACCTCTPTTATTSRSSARPARARQCTLFEVAEELGRRLVVDLHPRRARPPPRLRRDRAVPDATRTGRTCCCSTSTSTATTAPASAPATRPAGPASSPASSRSSATSAPRTLLSNAISGNLVYRAEQP